MRIEKLLCFVNPLLVTPLDDRTSSSASPLPLQNRLAEMYARKPADKFIIDRVRLAALT